MIVGKHASSCHLVKTKAAAANRVNKLESRHLPAPAFAAGLAIGERLVYALSHPWGIG
jgi:hypothetical protein